MNHLIFAVVVCLIICDSTSATDQHLICKSVDDVFTSDEQIHSTRRLRGPIQQGRPGKVGPPGTKGETGEKGQRGSEGIVDYSLVNESLKEMVTSATAELQAKVEKLENEILNITKKLPQLDDCQDGFIYGHKCYFAKVQSINSRSHGEQICSENNARLADIHSQADQTLVMNYMRGKMPDGRSYMHVWVGPKYEPSTQTIQLSSGKSSSASTLRWYPGFPSGSYTGIKLLIESVASHSSQGIFNKSEAASAHAVLCEK